jgi:hypothetical protein
MHRTSSTTPAVYPVRAILTPSRRRSISAPPIEPSSGQAVDNAAMLNTAGILYGTIMVGALLAAESAKQQNYADTVGAVAIAIALYWLVHSYTQYTERRVERREPFTLGGLGQTMTHELSIIAGAVLPLVALLLCWAVGATLNTAVNVDVYLCAAIIVLIEVGTSIRAELSGRELVAQISFGVFFGLLVIALNILLR